MISNAVADLLKQSSIFNEDGTVTLSSHIYQGVVVGDEYSLAQYAHLSPRVVLDIGAHVGCFAVKASDVWPNSTIISVEPHPDTFNTLSKVAKLVPRIKPLHAALGRGVVYFFNGPGSDSHGFVTASGNIFPDEFLRGPHRGVVFDVPAMMLDDIAAWGSIKQPYVVKVDTEGAEAVLYDDKASQSVFRNAALWIMEIHIKQATWDSVPEDNAPHALRQLATHQTVIHKAFDFLYMFSDTHNVRLNMHHPAIWTAWGISKESNSS